MTLVHKYVLFASVLVAGSLAMGGWALPSLTGERGASLKNQTANPERGFRVLHLIERIAYSDDWRTETRRTVIGNGHVFTILHLGADRCTTLESSVNGVAFFTFYPTRIKTPSYEGGKIGTFYEALVPRNAVSCDLSSYVFAEWQPEVSGDVSFRLGNETVTVKINLEKIFRAPTRPLYVGISNSFLIQGHCLGYCRREAELGRKYNAILRAHHIQPLQSWAFFPPIRKGRLDLDAGRNDSLSFRDLATAPGDFMVGFPKAKHYKDQVAYLKALEVTVREEALIGRAWVYVHDEPENMASLRDELILYRTYAPSVMTMVTMPFDKSLASYVDIFAPVLNQLRHGSAPYSGHLLWPYVSCMGSCGPNMAAHPESPRAPGPDTGLSDFLIDRPAEHLFAYFREMDRMGVDGGLYYHAVEGYRLVPDGVNLLEDPWNFGGNGDGLLLYPGRPGEFGLTEHQPLPSLRLKLIRYAIENFWSQ